MKKGFFVTGTDTGVGKTWATLYLMRRLQQQGFSTLGMKPVASGAEWRDGRLVNEDALALQAAASWPVPYEQVNPYVYEPPTSPHIAAALAGQPIDLERIVDVYRGLAITADRVLVEGVGGWLAPLGERERVADLALALGLPVILVVGVRLGCLNHALLTYAAIRASGLAFAGWVANHVDRDLPYAAENIALLTAEFAQAPLAILPYCDSPDLLHSIDFSASGAEETLRLLGS